MLVTTERLVADIRRAREDSFNTHSRALRYLVSRGIESSNIDRPPWVTRGYRELLPKLDGLDVMGFIQQVIDTKGVAKILDVGCGSGRFLYECKNGYRAKRDEPSEFQPGWGNQVDCYGLTACLYRFCDLDGIPDDNEVERRKYLAAGIQIEVQDAQSLVNLYDDQKFDVITAVHLLDHVADPWALFYGMYEKLTDGGACFVKSMPFNLKLEDDEVYDQIAECYIAEWLKSHYGATVINPYRDLTASSIRSGDIAIRRKRVLNLPLTYFQVDHFDYDPRITYRVDRQKVFQPI